MNRRDFMKIAGPGAIGLSIPGSIAASHTSINREEILNRQSSQLGGFGPARQREIYMAGLEGRLPQFPVNPNELEYAAANVLSDEAFAYVAGGAGGGSTMLNNRTAFEQYHIVPRMLRNVGNRDLRVNILGQNLPAPIILAPIGVQSIVHQEAESAVARAASSLNIPLVCSTVSSDPMEQIASTRGNARNWFQLYWPRNNALATSLVQRAERAGFGAIVITLDTSMLAWREKDIQLSYLPFLKGEGLVNYFNDPIFRALFGGNPAENMQEAIEYFLQIFSEPTLTWESLEQIRRATNLPIILKGILHPDDARLAIQHGASGIIVSNHGGRQIDGAVGALTMLPEIVDATGPEYPVLYDSGIRRGADVFKALALGAKAVLLGRPYAYGLAVNGEQGVKDVLQNLIADFDLTMGLTGCRAIEDINSNFVRKV